MMQKNELSDKLVRLMSITVSLRDSINDKKNWTRIDWERFGQTWNRIKTISADGKFTKT